MRILSILFTILCSAAIYNLHSIIQGLEQHDHDKHDGGGSSSNGETITTTTTIMNIYEKDVLTTTMYALASGLATNVACALVARSLDPEVIPGTEMMACAPYGIGAAAVAARLHTFSAGGWTAGHWVYVRRAPRLLATWVRTADLGGRLRALLLQQGRSAAAGMGGGAGGCSSGGNSAEDKCEL